MLVCLVSFIISVIHNHCRILIDAHVDKLRKPTIVPLLTPANCSTSMNLRSAFIHSLVKDVDKLEKLILICISLSPANY